MHGSLRDDDIARGLARVDPLTLRPRTSSRVLCIVLAVLLLATAAGVWWLGVRTENGQAYEDMVETTFNDNVPGWLAGFMGLITHVGVVRVGMAWDGHHLLVLIVSLLLGGIGLAVAVARRRWWLVGQLAVFSALCYAATGLKCVLPRPFIINTMGGHENSAPSGHTILAAASGMVLLLAVPRVWRAVAAIIACAWTLVVGLSVISGKWHRPADVAMSILLVGGIALLVLAFSRTSGMDRPGQRASSASVQIVGSVMVTGGLLCLAYGAYVVWQVIPGLSMSMAWAQPGAVGSAVVGICGVALLGTGLTLVMRQLTASPLTRLGLVGAPPAPPAAGRDSRGIA